MLRLLAIAVLVLTASGVDANDQYQDRYKYHPDKEVFSMKATSIPPTNAIAFALTTPSGTNTDGSSQWSPAATTVDINAKHNNTNSSDPHWYDNGNTVEVSMSLALPLVWNLTSPEDSNAVEALVQAVSTAATELFHTTLDYAITMLDGSPVGHVVAKDADAHNPDKVSHVNEAVVSSALENATAHPDDSIWETENGNQSGSLLNGSYTTNSSEINPSNETSETLLWDWLGMVPLSKEELYMMVLEYLDIEDEEDWQNASATSPLLRSLKAEIRQAIFAFFFLQQEHKYGNQSTTNSSSLWGTNGEYKPIPSYNNSGEWNPNDSHLHSDNDDPTSNTAPNSDSVYASGIWEMFLANTRVQLVLVKDTYAWWKLTMVYPVYVRYQSSYQEEAVHIHQLDETLTGAMHSNATAEANEPAPYWEPVTDQGTLDFISRLLQRVFEAAVHSGAFLSSLNSLQQEAPMASDAAFSDAAFAASAPAPSIVGEIIALTTPGLEHPLDELIAPYDESLEMGTTQAQKGIPTEVPMETPWGTGTYTQGLLDREDQDRRRQQMGLVILLATLLLVAGLVLMAFWRNVTAKRAERAWMLGTDHDVAELLQVGWRQYDVPNRSDDNSDDPIQAAEIIEVFDKSKEGYCDNDSMLHGSAMHHSQYDSSSEVPSAPMEYEKHLERQKGRQKSNMFNFLGDSET